jgi:hypothetical protein
LVGERRRAAAVLEELDPRSDHLAITRSYLHRKPGELHPPLWVREALNETATGASRLHAVEIAERFTRTQFTADMGE